MDFAVEKKLAEPHNLMHAEMTELLQQHGVRTFLHVQALTFRFVHVITHLRGKSLSMDVLTATMLRALEPCYCLAPTSTCFQGADMWSNIALCTFCHLKRNRTATSGTVTRPCMLLF